MRENQKLMSDEKRHGSVKQHDSIVEKFTTPRRSTQNKRRSTMKSEKEGVFGDKAIDNLSEDIFATD
jgi:hypothetical protein